MQRSVVFRCMAFRFYSCVVLLSLLMLATVETLAAEDEATIERKASDGTMKVYLSSPLKNSQTHNFYQTFDELKRDMSRKGNYERFQGIATDILNQTKKCVGSGNVEDRLQDCANTKPDEFATVTNMIRFYLEWESSEIRTILQLYTAKLQSPLLSQRIEARLINACLMQKMNDNDSAQSIQSCRSPSGWNITELFGIPKTVGSSECSAVLAQKNKFSYRDYVTKCVMTKTAYDSAGRTVIEKLLPDLRIVVEKGSLQIDMENNSVRPDQALDVLVSQSMAYLEAPWFRTNLVTQGCLPSAFAPNTMDNYMDKSSNTLTPEGQGFMSICIPTKIIQRLSALPEADRKFYNEVIANRLGLLKMMEVLNGMSLITQETARMISTTDSELGRMVQPFAEYSKILADSYKTQIDLAYASKLEDVLDGANELYDNYMSELNLRATNRQTLTEEMAKMKTNQSLGSKL